MGWTPTPGGSGGTVSEDGNVSGSAGSNADSGAGGSGGSTPLAPASGGTTNDPDDPGNSSGGTLNTEQVKATIRAELYLEFLDALSHDVLGPHYPSGKDDDGGFVEDRSSQWALEQDSTKSLHTQARHTWTTSKAAEFFSEDVTQAASFETLAAHGFDFVEVFWGAEHDGLTGWSIDVTPQGAHVNTDWDWIVVYAHAFGVYGSAAYYGLSGEQEALTSAFAGYDFLESFSYDAEHGAYNVSASNSEKDANHNLHVLEGVGELFLSLSENHARQPELRQRLEVLVETLHDSFIHCETTTDCFAYPVMAADGTSQDSRINFGHDLETGMLMLWALESLGEDPRAHPYYERVKKMIDMSLEHGVTSEGAVLEEGEYDAGTVNLTKTSTQFWRQAEALGALCWMHGFEPEAGYDAKLETLWSFTKDHMLDSTYRGWVHNADDWSADKGTVWHTTYHTGRALMACLQRLDPDE